MLNQNPDLQQVTTQVPTAFDKPLKSNYRTDKEGIIPSNLYTVISREKSLAIMQFLFWFVIFLASVTGIILNYFFNTVHNPKQGIGWYVLCGVVFLISLSLFAKALTRHKSWKRTQKNCKENCLSGNFAAITIIPDTFRSISFKKLRLSWCFAFFLTYFGIFNFILIGLLFTWNGVWHIQTGQPGDTLYININIVWEQVLNNAFGNVYTLLWIDLAVAIAVSVLFVIMQMYDRKRIAELSELLGSDAATYKTSVHAELRNENKAWIKAYIIIFIIVVLLPLALFFYLVWKGVIKRGSKK
ncbi:MSC_0882 family membrane protein [Mycoplasma seminis]|uniref:Uncharacterized protein n=1 Tax=Mycoplasma seminis TaxID=512749 RepID=A0ABY9HAF0_9MOLU|nr:hypothetical protein [Mycoplasma seminis]WLP85577.1 hypothetical protein Q8852_00160 [Mycoplasma seminis]